MKTMVKIVSTGLFGIFLACFLVSGCGDKPEPPEMETEAVVRQIMPEPVTEPDAVVPAEAPTEAPAEAPPVEATEAVETAADDEIRAPAEAPEPASPSETAAVPVAAPAPVEEAPPVEPEALELEPDLTEPEVTEPDMTEPEVTEPDPDIADPALMDSDTAAGPEPVIELDFELSDISGDVPGVEALDAEEGASDQDFYNPFAPLFKKEAAASLDMGEVGGREKRKFLTPLERIDLGQLQLEGIILAQSGNRAIVTDASGKGYVITSGTYIGLNSGIVDSIESDRVVVVEEVGNRAQKVVLKLQKPAGE